MTILRFGEKKFSEAKVSILPTFYAQIFFVQKSNKQLFWAWSLGLNIFGARNLALKLLIKCWWNWTMKSNNTFLIFFYDEKFLHKTSRRSNWRVFIKRKTISFKFSNLSYRDESFLELHCPPLNRITLCQHKSDNNNRMIQLTDVVCVLLKYR